ncbi:hypothetical protein RvY_05807-1 [Ramazzottius varieornatus]|uniref:Major facilitator superfamily (MFS) profile domain-containing protein n=1 Tax=Ramazzottius varieornatus TaxID=947166 RepID=A0A1D1UWC4_RAMVA|nr:hypothetical protein RvY_05807-1 [Ramazzottius varieornatus]
MYTFADCFRSPNVRKTTLLCLTCWFACYFGYLGVSYLSSEIATDVYLNLAINGLLELIPIALAATVASRLGNRLPLATYFLTGGIFAVIAGVIPGSSHAEVIAQNIVAFLSRLAFVGTCCVIFVYTTELFPTVIRNNAFSLCCTNLRIGSMIAPLLPLMAANTSFKGSGFIFVGIAAIIAALAAWLLRETKGQPLARTIDEVEKLAYGGMIGFLQLPLQTVKFNFRVRPPHHSGLRAKSVVALEPDSTIATRV